MVLRISETSCNHEPRLFHLSFQWTLRRLNSLKNRETSDTRVEHLRLILSLEKHEKQGKISNRFSKTVLGRIIMDIFFFFVKTLFHFYENIILTHKLSRPSGKNKWIVGLSWEEQATICFYQIFPRRKGTAWTVGPTFSSWNPFRFRLSVAKQTYRRFPCTKIAVHKNRWH